MLTTIFEDIKLLLQKGISEKGHAFRYCTVATVDQKNSPQQRIMVFRELGDHLELVVYTDQRSAKIKQLLANPYINLLFYDPKSRIQIDINGIAEILSEEETKKRWKTVQKNTVKDYCTTHAPGSNMETPDAITYDTNRPYFSAIKVLPKSIEYLRLDQPNHIKAKYTLKKERWEGAFIVP